MSTPPDSPNRAWHIISAVLAVLIGLSAAYATWIVHHADHPVAAVVLAVIASVSAAKLIIDIAKLIMEISYRRNAEPVSPVHNPVVGDRRVHLWLISAWARSCDASVARSSASLSTPVSPSSRP